MIKKIKTSTGYIKYNTKTKEGFDEILSLFDDKIKTVASRWVHSIKEHDVEDLAQICREKLIDILEKYNDKKEICFSTFMYTALNRKMLQMAYRNKSKKYSAHIKDDRYISNNYAIDKTTQSHYLLLDKHKCPIKRDVINRETCISCPHHNAYVKKKIERGFNAGKEKEFTMCKYFNKILQQRGIRQVSMDAPIRTSLGEDVSIENIIKCKKQSTQIGISEFNLDLEILKDSGRINEKSYKIIYLLLWGYNKNEIMKKLRMDPRKLGKYMTIISKNKYVLNILDK
jgi:hypothetical protein